MNNHPTTLFESELIEAFKKPERGVFCGMSYVIDKSVPEGEIHYKVNGKTVAKLILDDNHPTNLTTGESNGNKKFNTSD